MDISKETVTKKTYVEGLNSHSALDKGTCKRKTGHTHDIKKTKEQEGGMILKTGKRTRLKIRQQ